MIPICRIFVVHDAFRELMNSFIAGLQLIGTLCVLLASIFYICCFIAWYSFRNLEHNDVLSETLNFNTLGDSCLTMWQVPYDP